LIFLFAHFVPLEISIVISKLRAATGRALSCVKYFDKIFCCTIATATREDRNTPIPPDVNGWGRIQHDPVDDSQGELLRQRTDGELFGILKS
jgi:hypothetical protein